MPKVSIPDNSTCIHSTTHPKWHGTEGIWAMCRMPLPYLNNCIAMLRLTLADPTASLTDIELAETKDALAMMQVELQRRHK